MDKIKVIIMNPGQEAYVKDIDPLDIDKIVGVPNRSCYPLRNGIKLISRQLDKNQVARANRITTNSHGKEEDILYGTIVAVGCDEITEEIRSLTYDEQMQVMIEYREPSLKSYNSFGLVPGEELRIVQSNGKYEEIFWQEKMPDRIIVIKEYPHFISCVGIWKHFDGDSSYRFSINKPLDKSRIIIRKKTGRRLK